MTIQAAEFYNTCNTPESHGGEDITHQELEQVYNLGVEEGLIQLDSNDQVAYVHPDFLGLMGQIASDYQINPGMFQTGSDLIYGHLGEVINYGAEQCQEIETNSWTVSDYLSIYGLSILATGGGFGITSGSLALALLGGVVSGVSIALIFNNMADNTVPDYCEQITQPILLQGGSYGLHSGRL